MILATAMLTVIQVILAIPLGIWVIVSGIMLLEDENEGKRAATSAEWFLKFSPRWYKRVTCFIMLPLLIALLFCHHFGV